MIIERVITVEYLESSMSRDLLCKFPDHSAFDFDYTQSGIWSPLLPRGGTGRTTSLTIFNPPSSSSSPSSLMEVSKKLLNGFDQEKEENLLSDDDEDGDGDQENVNNNITTKIKNKISMKMLMKKKKKDQNQSLDLSITPAAKQSSNLHKGWAKVLKAASKQFKKQKSSSSQMKKMMNKIPNFLRN